MKKLFAIASALALVSCSGVDAVRISAGASPSQDFRAEVDGSRDRADGDGIQGRVELSKRTDLGPSVGVYVASGQDKLSAVQVDIESTHASVGGSIRHLFLDSAVSPFVEGRLGYRHTRLDVDQSGFQKDVGDGPGLETFAGLGVEWRAAERLSIFGQIDFGYAITDINGFHGTTLGPALFVGGEVRF